MNENELWTLYERWVPEKYQMFMYCVLELQLPFNVLRTLRNLWFNKETLFHVLNKHLGESNWEYENGTERTYSYSKETEKGVSDAIVLKYPEWENLEIKFKYYDFSTKIYRFPLLQREKMAYYTWNDTHVPRTYRLGNLDEISNVCKGYELTLVEFVKEIINRIL